MCALCSELPSNIGTMAALPLDLFSFLFLSLSLILPYLSFILFSPCVTKTLFISLFVSQNKAIKYGEFLFAKKHTWNLAIITFLPSFQYRGLKGSFSLSFSLWRQHAWISAIFHFLPSFQYRGLGGAVLVYENCSGGVREGYLFISMYNFR